MKPQTRTALAVVAGVFIALFTIIGYWQYWQTTVLDIDITAPVIDQEQTTHEFLAYSAILTVRCVVTEANEMGQVTARLIDNSAVPPVRELQLTLQTHTGSQYIYQGTFPNFTPQMNVAYSTIYTVVDGRGNSAAFATTITMVDLDGYVTLNGQQIDPNDIVKLKTLNLDIKVYVTSSHSIVDSVYATIKQSGSTTSQTISFDYKTQYWQGNYTVPSDGTWILEVIVKDKAGTKNRLASFTIALSSNQQNMMLLVVAFVLILALVIGYAVKAKKTEKTKK